MRYELWGTADESLILLKDDPDHGKDTNGLVFLSAGHYDSHQAAWTDLGEHYRERYRGNPKAIEKLRAEAAEEAAEPGADSTDGQRAE